MKELFIKCRRFFPPTLFVLAILWAFWFTFTLDAQAAGNVIRISSRYRFMGNPFVAMNASGNTIIAWDDKKEDSYDIFAQRFNPKGYPFGKTIHVNDFKLNDQRVPKVAMDAEGNFVVVWQSYGQDRSGSGIFGQRFKANGEKVGNEFKVNTFVAGNQVKPAVAMSEEGDFVVIWESRGQDSSPKSIYGQRFDAEANPLGNEFKVNAQADGEQTDAQVVMDSQKNFIVSWESYTHNDADIYLRKFDWSGAPLSPTDILVNTTTQYDQRDPAISLTRSGKFVVVWANTTDIPESRYLYRNIKGQVFNAGGSKAGKEFEVFAPEFTQQDAPTVIQVNSKDLLVVWQSFVRDHHESGWVIKGRRLDLSGKPIEDITIMNASRYYPWYHEPVLATDGKGTYTAVWSSTTRLGNLKTVHFRNDFIEPYSGTVIFSNQ